MQTISKTTSVIEVARKAKTAAGVLARLSTEEKNQALQRIAEHLRQQAKEILAANHNDLAAAQPLVASGEMADALFRRLKLDEAKLADILAGIAQVAGLEDPVGKITLATE